MTIVVAAVVVVVVVGRKVEYQATMEIGMQLFQKTNKAFVSVVVFVLNKVEHQLTKIEFQLCQKINKVFLLFN